METPISTIGLIIQRLRAATYRARLKNGKELVCHLPRKSELTDEDVMEGTSVELHFTPYDMEKARIARVVEL